MIGSTRRAVVASMRSMGTQSTDDAQKPTALAKLHLEDGTTITGKSFGSHEAVEGEVSGSIALVSKNNAISVSVGSRSSYEPFSCSF